MAVVIAGGKQEARGLDYWVRETLSQSTATAFQTINVTTPITHLGGGTATGHSRNRFSLGATGIVEGQEKMLFVTGTGERNIYIAGTATGLLVMTAADGLERFVFLSGKWFRKTSAATISTGT